MYLRENQNTYTHTLTQIIHVHIYQWHVWEQDEIFLILVFFSLYIYGFNDSSNRDAAYKSQYDHKIELPTQNCLVRERA